MNIDILDSKDKDKIESLMSSVSKYDIYHEPTYLDIFSRYLGDEWIYFFSEMDEGFMMEPFFIREIDGSDYFDLISPWYYGGPIFSFEGVDKKIKANREFREALHKLSNEMKLVSEFTRFHPTLENHVGLEHIKGHQTFGEVVVVDTTPDIEGIRSNYRKRGRKKLKSIDLERISTNNDLFQFKKVYKMAMNKKEADNYYLFDDQFFKDINDAYQERSIIMNVKIDGCEGCSTMAIGCNEIMTDFLRGRAGECFNNCSYLLVDRQLEKAHELGYGTFIMGGGRTKDPEDKLLRFKRSFSRKQKPFHLMKNIFDMEEYERLSRKEGLKDLKHESALYFPEYRFPE